MILDLNYRQLIIIELIGGIIKKIMSILKLELLHVVLQSILVAKLGPIKNYQVLL